MPESSSGELGQRPTHVNELIAQSFDYVGFCDVSAFRAGCMWVSGNKALHPAVWRFEFPLTSQHSSGLGQQSGWRTNIFDRGEDNKVFVVMELEEELALERRQVVLDLAAEKTCLNLTDEARDSVTEFNGNGVGVWFPVGSEEFATSFVCISNSMLSFVCPTFNADCSMQHLLFAPPTQATYSTLTACIGCLHHHVVQLSKIHVDDRL
jgi:hypothetical protein